MAETEQPTQTGQLGIERWVQFAYVGVFLLSFWLLDHLAVDVAAFVAEKANIADPNPTILTAGAAIASMLIAFFLYRNEKVNKFSREVAHELENVTWPSREDTWSNTLVVMVVSVIAAIILGAFDAAWSAVTDLIY